MIHCSEDDPELLQHLMTTMDIDKDGRISFEEFRSGLDTVTQHLDIIHSTPDNTRADRHGEWACGVMVTIVWLLPW